MWSDNETKVDLLGFSVHKDLILNLVTNQTLLPLTVGIFGDWGGGKSSVMRMLEDELKSDKYSEYVACLYFNGWVFEGYDDAKAALFSSILIQLGEHKRFGPKIKDGVVRLLKKVSVMRTMKLGFERVVVPFGKSALLAGAASGVVDPGTAAAAMGTMAVAGAASAATSMKDTLDGDENAVDWQELVNQDTSTTGPLDIRSLRDDFIRLLEDTKLKSLVVLIDDLDRCDPNRLIENLEAIKLFLAVPRTAFVIAADERIVRHAISKRYHTREVQSEETANSPDYNLITEYLEKLIQIPYHLPRLSPSEIESYMTLLFCRLHYAKDEDFDKIRTDCELARKENRYVTYGTGNVSKALGGRIPDELGEQLSWSNSIAAALTQNLKGNPRQVKRFLNALLLRKQLAEIAKLVNIKDDVLVKLMLLEYSRATLFNELYGWQVTSKGYPRQLADLEDEARQETAEETEPLDTPPPADDALILWHEPVVQQWLRSEPPLKDVDLSDYFWIARDRLTSTVSDASMAPPFVRRLFEQLLSPTSGERDAAAVSARSLEPDELATLLRLLSQQLERKPSEISGVDGFAALIEAGVESAIEPFLDILCSIRVADIIPNAVYALSNMSAKYQRTEDRASEILEKWGTTKEPVAPAARDALKDIRERKNQTQEL
jgi:hypothetical protein